MLDTIAVRKWRYDSMEVKRYVIVIASIMSVAVLTLFLYYLFCHFRERRHELADFNNLEIGMSYFEIVKMFGKPDRDRASGVFAPEYDLSDGNTLLLVFSSSDGLAGAFIVTPEYESIDYFKYRDGQIE
jgi:hypothetical protein